MQLFPALSTATDLFSSVSGSASASGSGGSGFDAVLSSFIEDGRYDYSGRPPGFSSHGVLNGTLNGETTEVLAEELRKRNVSEDSISKMQALAASGATVTIGTACQALTGQSRLTGELSDDERTRFKDVLGKMGFGKEEVEELLGYSDSGNTKALWNRITAKLGTLETESDISKDEWKALLRGLDLSASTRKSLMSLFTGDSQVMNGARMEELLTGAYQELAAREKAAAFARTQMRGAVEDALKASKIRELTDSVENNRGSRLLEQKEALMQNSVRKNTGTDEIKQDQHRNGDENFENRKDGKSRSEHLLTRESDSGPAKATTTGAGKESATAAEKFFQLIDSHGTLPQPQTSANQAQNLNTMARSHRQEIFSQVEQGLLQSARNGGSSLTLQLNPGSLGQVTVVLSVAQGELKATIRAENQESANVLREQMAELKASLEAQGLKVKELDVQTGLQNNMSSDQWDGHAEHNMMRDAEERNRLLRLSRIRREAGGNAAERAATAQATTNSGLHIVA